MLVFITLVNNTIPSNGVYKIDDSLRTRKSYSADVPKAYREIFKTKKERTHVKSDVNVSLMRTSHFMLNNSDNESKDAWTCLDGHRKLLVN